MNYAPITPSTSRSEFGMVAAVVFLTFGGFQLWRTNEEKNWDPAIFGLLFIIAGLASLRTWHNDRKGEWRIQWQGSFIQILDGDRLEYEGDLAGLHRIDQDGRGYLLYLTSETLFRLRRGQSSAALEALLDSGDLEST